MVLYAFAKVGTRATYVCIEKSTRALQSPYFIVSAQKMKKVKKLSQEKFNRNFNNYKFEIFILKDFIKKLITRRNFHHNIIFSTKYECNIK